MFATNNPTTVLFVCIRSKQSFERMYVCLYIGSCFPVIIVIGYVPAYVVVIDHPCLVLWGIYVRGSNINSFFVVYFE